MKPPFYKRASAQIALIAIVTAFAGEFKINPFDGDIFRIGLGVSAFLLLLLLMRHLNYIAAGLAAGAAVLILRTSIDLAGASFTLEQSLARHGSAAVYYVVFALLMSLLKNRLDRFHPLALGAVTACIDLFSNEMELLTRFIMLENNSFRLNEWTYLMAIAMLRTYFTTGIYSGISVSQLRAVRREQDRRIEQMLGFGSGLYGEVFYLRKSIGSLEKATLESYELYRKLKDEGDGAGSGRLLAMTQQIHEAKKDSQRILAGLTKLVDREATGDMPLSGIVRFAEKSNSKYAELLGKSIAISVHVAGDYTTERYIPLLTLVNNLTANAVEAIRGQGRIMIDVFEQDGRTIFTITDSGPGIAERDMDLLFEPGFTTKFDEAGVAATGIGLSHVRDIAEHFGGLVRAMKAPHTGGAMFRVELPTRRLRKEE